MKLTPAKRKILEYLRDNPKARLVSSHTRYYLLPTGQWTNDSQRLRYDMGSELGCSPWLEQIKAPERNDLSYWYRFVSGARITPEWYESAMAARRQNAANAQAKKDRIEQERRDASARKLDLFKCAFVPDENYVADKSYWGALYVRLGDDVYRVENVD